MQTRFAALLGLIGSGTLLLGGGVAAAEASSMALVPDRFDNDRASVQIEGDRAANDIHIDLVSGGAEVKFTDRKGSPLELNDVAARLCSGGGSSPVVCPRRALKRPIPIRPTLGRADSFDIGAHGCAGGDGFEIYFGYLTHVRLWGTAESDQLYARDGSVVHGCSGDDDVEIVDSRFAGGAGGDFIDADKGSRVLGQAGGDQIDAGNGVAASGGSGDDGLSDQRGSSKLVGGSGRDGIYSGPGRDTLVGGAGKDTLAAGSRTRIVDDVPLTYKETPTEPDRLDCGSGKDRATAGHRSRLRGCERVEWLPRTFVAARLGQTW